jgi:hypothetical protein
LRSCRLDDNDNADMAYYRAVCSFFAWLEQYGIGGLADIEPLHVAAYNKSLQVSEPWDRTVRQRAAGRPTVKQHWLLSGCCSTACATAR